MDVLFKCRYRLITGRGEKLCTLFVRFVVIDSPLQMHIDSEVLYEIYAFNMKKYEFKGIFIDLYPKNNLKELS